MAVTKLGPNRYRAQAHHRGKNIDVGKILGGPSIFAKKADATAAVARAKARLKANWGDDRITLATWADRWTSDPLFARPKASTNSRYAYIVAEFVELYGHVPIRDIDYRHISEYLAGGKRGYRVSPLKSMFQDAMTAEGGRLIDANPWNGLKIRKGPGNSDKQPPTEEQVWEIIHAARFWGPSLQAWFQVACFTGMRGGELDGLQWKDVDFANDRINVVAQFSNTSKTFTLPKNGRIRKAIMTAPAREALLSVRGLAPRFVFPGVRSAHWTFATRWRPWLKIREDVGWDKSLYLATRHFAGFWLYNELLLDAEDVGMALGHKDGKLVRERYGHRSVDEALERVAAAAARHEHRRIPTHSATHPGLKRAV